MSTRSNATPPSRESLTQWGRRAGADGRSAPRSDLLVHDVRTTVK